MNQLHRMSTAVTGWTIADRRPGKTMAVVYLVDLLARCIVQFDALPVVVQAPDERAIDRCEIGAVFSRNVVGGGCRPETRILGDHDVLSGSNRCSARKSVVDPLAEHPPGKIDGFVFGVVEFDELYQFVGEIGVAVNLVDHDAAVRTGLVPMRDIVVDP